jgi:cell division protein ftsI/penicillin-binding protein
MKKKKNIKAKSNINVANKISPKKIGLILFISLFLMIALLLRVAYLQFVDGNRLQKLATSQQTLTETISAKRGTIYDSTGNALAISYETDKIYVTPSLIKTDANKTAVAQNLASILELDYNDLLTKILNTTDRFLVASEVEQDKVDAINNWKKDLKYSTGISFEETTSRSYPYKTLASTIIGFVGADNQGSTGIESSWNSFLSGTAGKSVSLKDASQSEIANSNQSYIAAENGYDVSLTIDSNIQSIVEKHLSQAVDEYKCESGITIAMDPSTGKILAMADYPSYDCNNQNQPNSYLAKTWDSLSSEKKNEALYRMWTPKAVTDEYEPGSVFKIVTSSIALEENVVDTDTVNFNCTGAYYVPGESRPIKCHKYPNSHGAQSLRQALENSCNPAFVDLGLRIGKNRTYKYYEAYGFFEKTGISLSGEPKSGIFYDINKINDHELGTMSFGQRFTITPLQMITAASAIANDGVLLQPQIVDHITNTDTGEVTTFTPNEVRKVISKETADKVASMMESVVEIGTGKKVKYDDSIKDSMSGYSIGGKTGTSEPINGSSDGYVASFLAISPVENTKIVLLVILKNPGEGVNHNGGQIAAPTAGKMLSEILPYLGIDNGNKDSENNSNISEKDLY